MSATSRHSADDVDVWDESPWVVVVTHEAVHAKRFDTVGGREKALDKIEAGEDPGSVFGIMSKSVSYRVLRSAAVVPDMGVLLVQGRRTTDPIRTQFQNKDAALQVFESLRERLRHSQGGEWEVQTSKANANDVPLDPQLGIALVFGIIAILGLVMGAMEGVPNQGFIIAIALAWLGNLLGKVGSFVLAGAAVVAAIYFCMKWVKALPPKLTMRRV